MNIDYEYLKNTYYNKNFITIFIITFIVLFLFCSIMNFIGKLPILILVTVGITYFIYNKYYISKE
jgi:hypothetical protein